MFEHKSQPLLGRAEFYRRMVRSFGFAMAIVAFSLTLGTVGYHLFGNLVWIDALLNAAMILTGMGPVDPMKSVGGKLFSAFYALYSGIAFLTMMAVVGSPLVHRFMHKFHLEDDTDQE
jgi:hypothetical protein